MIALTVINPFADHQRGDQITEPAMIAEIIASTNSASVVRMILPDPPPSEPAPA